MPSRGSPNGPLHTLHNLSTARSPGRDRPEQVVVIDWNGWSSSIGTGGRHHPVRAGAPFRQQVGGTPDSPGAPPDRR